MAEETEAKIIRAGWMKKKGNKGNLWGDRYFTLRGPTLSYFLKQADVVRFHIYILLIILLANAYAFGFISNYRNQKEYLF